MAKKREYLRSELLRDYGMLGDVSVKLVQHRKNIRLIAKTIARRMKSDLKYGLIENLEDVAEHIEKAQKELDRARKEIKKI